MARDLDRAISLILGDLNRGTEHSDRAREAICDAIAFFTPTRLGFNTTLVSLSWSQSIYQALPSNWLETDYLRVMASTYREPLIEKPLDWMNEEDQAVTTVTGPPRFYAIENRLVRLYPAPDADYTVAVAYLAELTEVSLSADGNATNAWLNEGWALIKARAMADMIENYLGGEELLARLPGLARREEMTLDSMKRRANREQGGGRLEPWL